MYSRPGGRVGGIATAATGFAAAFFDVLALTVIYDRIPVVAGLVLGLGIAGVGLVLARHWNSQPFASGVVAAITVLAPFLTDGFTVELAAFALILLIASLTAQVGRNWPVLHAFRTVGVSLTLLTAIHVSYTASLALLAMSVMALLVTLVGSLWLLTGEHDDITSSVMIAVASSPVLYGALFFPVWPLGVLVPVGVAVVMGAVLLLVGALPVHARITVAAVAGWPYCRPRSMVPGTHCWQWCCWRSRYLAALSDTNCAIVLRWCWGRCSVGWAQPSTSRTCGRNC
ncbi:putative membrane protein [Mycobacteroides abscessus 1948]|uniref:Putative membrane protein n=1 Tax=Mycobacteroides abscessus 1948 TaxID=1299323 RepID=A0A829QKA2_9MYCO|nr:putative membrane protein [Mycobacteroides abscessus 1948]